ncbi:type II toxin-antitoxin system PemK/MazF family toxin [Brevibacillus sp. TJ4]|uniref:type II toxin-antitoxin system PemK/MazF family toxin n=1 Tax=Brevibacillus sp. TJ4 TaxID=3234853 RepID=UPI0037CF8C52
MSINTGLLRVIYNSKTSAERESIIANKVPEVEVALSHTLQDTQALLRSREIGNVIEFVLSNDRWNDYGVYGPKQEENRTTLRGRKINRGRLVFIDFGHNIGKELSLPHLGIVVGNFPKTVVVVPVRSDRGQAIEGDFVDAVIKVKKVDYPQFAHDSELMIHQIRTVDKNRILRDTGKSVSGTVLMKKIEEAIYKSFAKFLYSQNEAVKQEMDVLKLRLQQKDALLQEIKNVIGEEKFEQVAAAMQKEG